jgi:hypothetical protein
MLARVRVRRGRDLSQDFKSRANGGTLRLLLVAPFDWTQGRQGGHPHRMAKEFHYRARHHLIEMVTRSTLARRRSDFSKRVVQKKYSSRTDAIRRSASRSMGIVPDNLAENFALGQGMSS